MEKDDDGFPMKPQKILWDVRQHLGPDDILLSDVGAHKMWIARYYQCETANTCLISNGFCSMGFALPGAMGAKLAHPDRKVLAIAGDAGFLMNVQDLETLVRYRQNVVIMVWDDGEYGLIKWKQQNHFDGRHSDLAFNNPDFELLARSFGAWGRTLTTPGQLPDALDEAFPAAGTGAARGAGRLRGEREAQPAAGESELQHLNFTGRRRSAYGFAGNKVAAALRSFSGRPNVSVESPARLAEALDRAEKGMDFADALHLGAAARCEGHADVRQAVHRDGDGCACQDDGALKPAAGSPIRR